MYVSICIYYKANTFKNTSLGMSAQVSMNANLPGGKSSVWPIQQPRPSQTFHGNTQPRCFSKHTILAWIYDVIVSKKSCLRNNNMQLSRTRQCALGVFFYHIWFTTLCTFWSEKSQGGELLQVCVLELVGHKKGRKSGSTYGSLWRL